MGQLCHLGVRNGDLVDLRIDRLALPPFELGSRAAGMFGGSSDGSPNWNRPSCISA